MYRQCAATLHFFRVSVSGCALPGFCSLFSHPLVSVGFSPHLACPLAFYKVHLCDARRLAYAQASLAFFTAFRPTCSFPRSLPWFFSLMEVCGFGCCPRQFSSMSRRFSSLLSSLFRFRVRSSTPSSLDRGPFCSRPCSMHAPLPGVAAMRNVCPRCGVSR